MGVTYLDSSALVKLVVAEPESSALAEFLRATERAASSRLAAVEVARAARRVGADATEVLAGVELFELTSEILERAVTVDPPSLGTLDAVHLASALWLEDRVEHVVAYDRRLVEAARVHGLDVRSPA